MDGKQLAFESIETIRECIATTSHFSGKRFKGKYAKALRFIDDLHKTISELETEPHENINHNSGL